MSESVAHFAVASVVRNWIHETELSQCHRFSDECPDWPLAYEVADRVIAELDLRGLLIEDKVQRVSIGRRQNREVFACRDEHSLWVELEYDGNKFELAPPLARALAPLLIEAAEQAANLDD